MNELIMTLPDGITVPFVLVAGLSAALPNTFVIFITGTVCIAVVAITMGIGAYFTTKTERHHFNADIASKGSKERKFLSKLDIGKQVQDLATEQIVREKEQWSDLMNQKQGSQNAGSRGLSIALACIAGGLLPILPFYFSNNVDSSLKTAALISFAGLFLFGVAKGRITGYNPWKCSFRILLFATMAAACAYGVVYIVKANPLSSTPDREIQRR
ncbi:MAG: VIT1/CCC1 transporter family protein [Chitinophagaceae bacterium]|nr:VIT1/CCC1 transporter family protein [Chitinophagaceae bacterium]